MTRQETAAVLAVLKAAFPSFYRDMGKADLVGILNLWTAQFADDNFEAVNAAVNALIATKVDGFPPTIGAVKDKLHRLTVSDELTEEDAWDMVRAAASNGLYGAEEEFQKLPSTVRRAVGSANQLRAWARVNTDELDTVVASNFMRTFKTVKKREQEMAMIPADVKAVLSAVADRMAIDAPGRDKLEAWIG